MSDVLILLGHPDPESFNKALAESYARGVSEAGATARTIRLAELSFDPILRGGFREEMPLEPDLLEARAAIEAAAAPPPEDDALLGPNLR